MSKEVTEYVKKCPKCQLNKSHSKHEEEFVITPTPKEAFSLVCIDTIGPFLRTTNDNKYAVTVQCELTSKQP